MAQAKKRVPRLDEFSKPLIAKTESSSITKTLDHRLELLCRAFGITSGNKYRALCLTLLAEVLGVKGFQVLGEPPKWRGGAPVVWTFRRHADLVRYVKMRVSKGDTLQVAIGQAREKFARVLSDPDLTDTTVRAEYYRAKRFIEASPRVAAAMLCIDPEQENHALQAFARFLEQGATVETAYGPQRITATHLVQPKRKAGKTPQI